MPGKFPQSALSKSTLHKAHAGNKPATSQSRPSVYRAGQSCRRDRSLKNDDAPVEDVMLFYLYATPAQYCSGWSDLFAVGENKFNSINC